MSLVIPEEILTTTRMSEAEMCQETVIIITLPDKPSLKILHRGFTDS